MQKNRAKIDKKRVKNDKKTGVLSRILTHLAPFPGANLPRIYTHIVPFGNAKILKTWRICGAFGNISGHDKNRAFNGSNQGKIKSP